MTSTKSTVTYAFDMTEEQWETINNALLAAIGFAAAKGDNALRDQMLAASYVMDDIVNGSDEDEDDEPDADALRDDAEDRRMRAAEYGDDDGGSE